MNQRTTRNTTSASLPSFFVLVTALTAMVMSGSALAQVRAALTANVDDPGRSPYQASVRQFCFLASPACDFTFPAVPTGKRLVVLHASGYFSSRQTDSTQFIFVSVRKGGNDDIFLPTNFQGCGSTSPVVCPTSIFVFNQNLQEIYNAGDAPVVRIATGDRGYPLVGSVPGSPLPVNNTVTLTGYMVDCTTAAPCQAMTP